MVRWALVALFIGFLAATVVVSSPSPTVTPVRSRPALRPAAPIVDNRPRQPFALGVPHIVQEPELSVPTAAAMVLAFYGDRQPPRRLKALAAGRPYDASAPSDDFSATPYPDLIRGLKTLRYSWSEQALPATEAGFAQGLALVQAEIARGRPVLLAVTLESGVRDTLVVDGVDPDQHVVYAVDPLERPPGRRAVTFDALRQTWAEPADGGRTRSMILTRPRGLG